MSESIIFFNGVGIKISNILLEKKNFKKISPSQKIKREMFFNQFQYKNLINPIKLFYFIQHYSFTESIFMH